MCIGNEILFCSFLTYPRFRKSDQHALHRAEPLLQANHIRANLESFFSFFFRALSFLCQLSAYMQSCGLYQAFFLYRESLSPRLQKGPLCLKPFGNLSLMGGFRFEPLAFLGEGQPFLLPQISQSTCKPCLLILLLIWLF